MKKAFILACAASCCMAITGCAGQQKEAEVSADELYDRFLAGEIDAYTNGFDSETTFNLIELQELVGEEGADLYREKVRIDLDNDGENELLLTSPYGGVYLDAIDGNVSIFAMGEGSGAYLSYIYYEQANGNRIS